MYDIAIIGAGPAGLSAALNAYARKKKVVVIGRAPETSSIYKAENINNHLGYINVTGKVMTESFVDHIKTTDVELMPGRVQNVQPFGESFMLNVDNNIVEASTVILATGVTKKSTITDENFYVGKGLSYCATCDGMFYKGRDVVLYAEIEEALEDIKFLSEICNSVTVVHTFDIENKIDGVTYIRDRVNSIIGLNKVEGVRLIKSGQKISCDGLFIVKASISASTLLDGIETDSGLVVVNREMKTNIKGVFACGDIIGSPYQVSKAIGEGQVAGLSAVRYLDAN